MSLTRGLNLTLLRAFPVNAATWAAVTWVIRYADSRSTPKESYIKLSELNDAKRFFPSQLPISTSICAEAGKTIHPVYRDKETLSRSAMNACKEDSSLFQQLLLSIPGSLYKF